MSDLKKLLPGWLTKKGGQYASDNDAPSSALQSEKKEQTKDQKEKLTGGAKKTYGTQ